MVMKKSDSAALPSPQPEDSRAIQQLEKISRAIRDLEGLPVEYRLARKLADVQKEIAASATRRSLNMQNKNKSVAQQGISNSAKAPTNFPSVALPSQQKITNKNLQLRGESIDDYAFDTEDR